MKAPRQVTPLTPEEADSYASQMADLIAAKLQSQHLIPGEFSSDIGKWIRTLNRENDFRIIHTMPIGGQYNTPVFYVTFLASGAIKLEFTDINGCIFWTGVIQPTDRIKLENDPDRCSDHLMK